MCKINLRYNRTARRQVFQLSLFFNILGFASTISVRSLIDNCKKLQDGQLDMFSSISLVMVIDRCQCPGQWILTWCCLYNVATSKILNTDNNLGRGEYAWYACLCELICLTNTEYKQQSRNNFICKQTFRHFVLTIFTVLSTPMRLKTNNNKFNFN